MPPSRKPPSKKSPRGFTSFRDVNPTRWKKLGKLFSKHGVRQPKFSLGDGTEITTDDCVQIATGEDYSNTSAENESWFAEILEIKSDNRMVTDIKDIFVRIRWFYTRYNLEHYHRTVGHLSTCRFGKNEVVLSNHIQVIPAVWVVRKVRILCFNEGDQSNRGDYIGPKDRWYRYHFKVGWDRIMTKKDQRMPLPGCGLPGCGLRYSPDDEIQRFCPRWLCREWWHEKCLRNRELDQLPHAYALLPMLVGTPGFRGADDVVDDETPVDNSNSLDVDKEFDRELAKICSETLESIRAIEQLLIQVKDYQDKNLAIDSSIIQNEEQFLKIENIVWCARSPIVRGREYGVVGTGELVAKARRLLKQIAETTVWPVDPELWWRNLVPLRI